MTSIAFMMAAMTTALCGCTDKTVMQTDGDGNATSANDSFRIDMTRAVPGQYLSETTQQGQVVRIEYESKDYTRDDRPATRKPAYVYLPYGYDESRQYNVVYLMHGWTGTAEDTFGALGGAQKNILDWMIQQGDCQPVIVVSPTWDKDNQAKGWGESCEEIAVFHNEYENDLIPAVESRFATFAETTDRAGIVASRDHRAFGGFSLGSVTTWYVFEHCFDLQRFFLPMSGDSWHVATSAGRRHPNRRRVSLPLSYGLHPSAQTTASMYGTPWERVTRDSTRPTTRPWPACSLPTCSHRTISLTIRGREGCTTIIPWSSLFTTPFLSSSRQKPGRRLPAQAA